MQSNLNSYALLAEMQNCTAILEKTVWQFLLNAHIYEAAIPLPGSSLGKMRRNCV